MDTIFRIFFVFSNLCQYLLRARGHDFQLFLYKEAFIFEKIKKCGDSNFNSNKFLVQIFIKNRYEVKSPLSATSPGLPYTHSYPQQQWGHIESNLNGSHLRR